MVAGAVSARNAGVGYVQVRKAEAPFRLSLLLTADGDIASRKHNRLTLRVK
jgi:hypothetical protein